MFEARQKFFLSCFSCRIAKLCSYFLLIFQLLIKWKEKKQLWLYELKAHFNQTPQRQHERGCVFISFYFSRCYWITLFCCYEIHFKMNREIIGSKVTKKKNPPESRELKRKHLARQRAGNQVKLQQVWNVTDLRLHTWTRVHTCITTSSRQLHTGRPIPGQLVGGLLRPEYLKGPFCVVPLLYAETLRLATLPHSSPVAELL